LRNTTHPVHPNTTLCRVFYRDANAAEVLAQALIQSVQPHIPQRELVVLSIGTDRSTGDALGPLVGTHLEQLNPAGLRIYGTLDEPVHAMNLKETIERIRQEHPHAYILSVDACLGQYKHIGMICLQEGSLRPGAGVNKRLPEVGDLSFTCVVNAGGFMEYFVLQNTRLAYVMKMAQVMAYSIHLAWTHMHQKTRQEGPLITIRSLEKNMPPPEEKRHDWQTG
jgi:putative sporulation protein YyaC